MASMLPIELAYPKVSIILISNFSDFQQLKMILKYNGYNSKYIFGTFWGNLGMC